MAQTRTARRLYLGRGGELLGAARPTYSLDDAPSSTTPTGAALLSALVTGWGPMPAMTIAQAGFGAGTAELGDRPNLTQVVIGERDPRPQVVSSSRLPGQRRRRDRRAARLCGGRVEAAHDAWLTPSS